MITVTCLVTLEISVLCYMDIQNGNIFTESQSLNSELLLLSTVLPIFQVSPIKPDVKVSSTNASIVDDLSKSQCNQLMVQSKVRISNAPTAPWLNNSTNHVAGILF